MLTSKLIGAKVFSIHAGHNVGTVKSWLIDLKDLKVSIITVELSDKALNYLLAGDIRSLGAGGKHMVPLVLEDGGHQGANTVVVFHEQDVVHGHSFTSCSSLAPLRRARKF